MDDFLVFEGVLKNFGFQSYALFPHLNVAQNIAFAAPKEGASIACDDLVIPKSAAQIALAHAFISEVIGDVGEALALYTRMRDQVKAAE